MEVATDRACKCSGRVVQNTVGAVMCPMVLTSHLYAELPPWTAALQAAPVESPELPHSWALTAGIVLPSSPALGQPLRAQRVPEPL